MRVNFSESAAPPTSSGTVMPAALRSPAVMAICWVLFTSSPERPMASGWCSWKACTSKSDGALIPRLITRYPLFARMISTRFLPMSCTSPFTVARITVPRVGGFRLLHEPLQMADGRLHGFRRLQHLRHNQLVVVEEPAHLGHPGHQRAVDDGQRRRALGELAIEVRDQAVPGPLDDVVGQALVERQVLRRAA